MRHDCGEYGGQRMSKRKALPYGEGDWFAVPLSGGGFALGIVARMAPNGTVLLGYFFGPRLPDIPALDGLLTRRPQDALLVSKFGDLGLSGLRWPVIGKLPQWDRTVWPMPDFGRDDLLRDDVYWRVRYPGDNPNGEPYETRISKAEYDQLPEDGIEGSAYLEARLNRMLGASTRAKAAVAPSEELLAVSPADPAAVSVTHYLYFPSVEAATRVAERILADGSQVTVHESDHDWLVLVEQMIPATQDALDQVEAQLGEVATAEGGEYDGYERETRRYPLTPS